MTEKPVIFVASSSEQLSVAQRIRDGLRSAKDWDVNVWTTQFAFSATYIDSLERALDKADFAVIVMTGDDQANVRKDSVVLPRDNVIFELGLFLGRLGRERCAFFHDASRETRIASDLEGVKGADFYPDDRADQARPALGDRVREVKRQIKQVLHEAGPRYKVDRNDRELQQKRWRIIKRLEGDWWERMQTATTTRQR
jgi:predicted nucleotide-binding protein